MFLCTVLLLMTSVICEDSKKAVCKMYHFESASYIGDITFTQQGSDHPVQLSGRIQKLIPGFHGIHVHEKGQITNYCNDAGGHFNPFNQTHGGPKDFIRHVGDLGNLLVPNSTDPTYTLYINDSKISLYSGESDISGRVLAIHHDKDDLGLGKNTESKINGHSGVRIACCVIDSSATKLTLNMQIVVFAVISLTTFL